MRFKRVSCFLFLLLLTGFLLAGTAAEARASSDASSRQITLSPGQHKRVNVSSSGSRLLSWHSSDRSVATVSHKGVITAKKSGTARIQATVRKKKGKKKKVSFQVTVIPDTEAIRNHTFRSIAHRGYTTEAGTGNNLLSSFYAAARRGFNCAECDIRITRDGQFVCSHDKVFADSVSGTLISIPGSTLEELRTHSFYGGQIATLEEVLRVCRQKNLELYLDKVSDIHRATDWKALFRLIEASGMKNRVSWLIRGQKAGETILQWDPAARIVLGVTIAGKMNEAISTANALKTGQNQVCIDIRYKFFTIKWYNRAKAELKPGITLEMFSVNNRKDYLLMLPYVSGLTSDTLCLKDLK